MNPEALTNPIVRIALQALERGDLKAWHDHFTADAELYDDGNPRNFGKFSAEAVGHEKFTHIDRVENNGLDVYGKFHSDQWGDFDTYFKFSINKDGKIIRLDIGQA